MPSPIDVLGLNGSLRAAVHDPRAWLIAGPEYDSSVPGGLENAIDWNRRF